MAKEGKVDKKDKKRKEHEQEVGDVEMGDVAPEVRFLEVKIHHHNAYGHPDP